MRRRTFDALLAIAGLVLSALLVIAGSLLVWGHSFIANEVKTQLAQQQITFPAAGSKGLDDPAIKPYLSEYAGQQLLTGPQARAFADHYIAVHLKASGGGLTYSQLSAKARANPTDAVLAAQVETSFKGETLRGLLLNAYAFAKMGQIALWGALAAFIGAGLLLLLSGLGFLHARRTDAEAEILHHHEAITPITA
jgi:hypothetical protein